MTTSNSLISGIQQIGIGVVDAGEAFKWYNKTLGLNVPVFDDVAEAKLMVKYTKGNIRQRRAILAVNMAGGGGAEIWESKRPLPLAPSSEAILGDIGIFAAKIKCQKISDFAVDYGLKVYQNPDLKPIVWLRDPYRNPLQIVEDNSWFKKSVSNTGGVLGAIIGVTDIDNSLKLYRDSLGLEVVYDKQGLFQDLVELNAHNREFRRVLLKRQHQPIGAFSRLFGNIEIELFQDLTRKPNVIMEGRSWGDLGYIHLCFDALNMEALGEKLLHNGFPFTVDSANSFDMGDAAGRFTYIEDPDGTLIEFVETHKVPVLKKIGWFIDLKKRGNTKPLPNWMVNTIGWGKVKA